MPVDHRVERVDAEEIEARDDLPGARRAGVRPARGRDGSQEEHDGAPSQECAYGPHPLGVEQPGTLSRFAAGQP